MPSTVDLYYELAHAQDEETRARIIANALERIEDQLARRENLPTRQDLSETELRLQKEIEQLRSEMHEMDARLTKEIEQLRAETHEMDARLTKEIEQVRAELKTDIAQTKVDVIKWTASMLVIQLGLFGTLVKLLVG